MGNVSVEAVLVVNNSASLDQLPLPEEVVQDFQSAVLESQANGTRSIFDPDSVQVSRLSSESTTTVVTQAPERSYRLQATLDEAFTPELRNSSSPQYVQLARQVEAEVQKIVDEDYFSIFVEVIVVTFRSNMGNVSVEAVLVVNNSAPLDQLPLPEEVVQDFQSAVLESQANGTRSNMGNVSVEAVLVVNNSAPLDQLPLPEEVVQDFQSAVLESQANGTRSIFDPDSVQG
ncbi:uncharacterized protein LOC141784503 [Halichoeres trimaculatus]|uniref:uncharacterized protein LOC141784503 n=1 Tax=Halichoeres trimaculatus TaxID=147232 RepID=UPI003D9F8B31